MEVLRSAAFLEDGRAVKAVVKSEMAVRRGVRESDILGGREGREEARGSS